VESIWRPKAVGGVGTSQFLTHPPRTPVVGSLGEHGRMGSVFLSDLLRR